uniref:Uncharacterized protein n=1 Tax=Glossina palpalis gambiensis TaxID=67801 RepID=A0A1B0BT11_9MUSC
MPQWSNPQNKVAVVQHSIILRKIGIKSIKVKIKKVQYNKDEIRKSSKVKIKCRPTPQIHKNSLYAKGNARGLRICIPPTAIILVSIGLGVTKAYLLGCFLADAPLLPMLSRTLFKSSELKCCDEMLTHVSMLKV